MQVSFGQSDVVRSVSKAQRHEFVSTTGIQSSSHQEFTPVSGTTTNSLLFNITPSSTSTILDACILLKCKVTLTVAPTGAVQCHMGRLCLESRPLMKMISNIQLILNGTPISVEPSRFIALHERTSGNSELRKRFASMYPSQLNPAGLEYNDMLGSLSADTNNIMGGSLNLSPFCHYNGHCDNFGPSRFAFQHIDRFANGTQTYIDDTDTTVGNRTREYDICEPIFLGDFLSENMPWGLSNLNSVYLKINFESDSVKLVACNPFLAGGATQVKLVRDPYIGNAYASNVITANSHVGSNYGDDFLAEATISLARSNEKVLCMFYQPSGPIPSTLSLPISLNQSYIQSESAVAGFSNGGEVTLNINNIKQNQTPSTIYIAVRQPLSQKTVLLSDALFRINSVNFTINGVQGVLSNMTIEQLYLMSCRNGYVGDYASWTSSGCVLILKSGVDFKAYAGSIGQFSFSGTIKVSNVFATALTKLETHIFMINDGVLHLNPSSAQIEMGFSVDKFKDAEQRLRERLDNESDSDGDDEATDPVSASGLYGDRSLSAGSAKSFWRGLKRRFLRPVYNQVLKPVFNDIVRPAIGPALKQTANLALGAVGLPHGSGRMTKQQLMLENGGTSLRS